jgi:hypothetical protein
MAYRLIFQIQHPAPKLAGSGVALELNRSRHSLGISTWTDASRAPQRFLSTDFLRFDLASFIRGDSSLAKGPSLSAMKSPFPSTFHMQCWQAHGEVSSSRQDREQRRRG